VTTKVFIATGDAPGRIEDPERATISVFDRGFLYGDSVYETMRTAGGLPLELEGHLERLHRSAAGIGLDVPGTDPELAASIAATHAASGNDESYVRVIVTRGSGPLMLDPRASISPTIVIVVQPLSSSIAPRARAASIPRSSPATISPTCSRCARRSPRGATTRS
jgi:branched-subunit amino acid aminotransferase/4-amino-4-deoxychorismate lyase